MNSVPVVGTVKAYDIGTVALVENPKFRHYLFLHGGLDLQMDHLLGHDGAGRYVAYTMHHAFKIQIIEFLHTNHVMISSLTSIAGSELRMLLEVVVAFQFANLVLQAEKHFEPLLLLIVHARDGDFFQLLDHDITMAEKKILLDSRYWDKY